MKTESEHEPKELRILDTLGVCASSLCLVHCLAMPFLITLLPALTAKYLGGSIVHHSLAFFVAFFCLSAIIPGYMRHRNHFVFLYMVAGLSLVLFATFYAAGILGEYWEVPIITFGNIFVVTAHLRNRKLAGDCAGHSHALPVRK